MTPTLVFGGTFDPVHNGHIRSAKALLKEFKDAKLVMIPCQIPPHRPQPIASAQARLAMLNLAVEGDAQISVDDCELEREGKSLTVDTLTAYREAEPEAALYFVMGSDAWVTLPGWYRWQELTDLAHLIVLTRPGEQVDEPGELEDWANGKETSLDQVEGKAGNIVKLTLEQVPVSATCVRRAIHEGRGVNDLLTAKVIHYIDQEKLYI